MNRFIFLFIIQILIFKSASITFSQNSTEKDLKRALIRAKNANQRVDYLNKLVDYYSLNNLKEKEKTIHQLIKEKTHDLDEHSINIIYLTRAEEYLREGNIFDFIKLYENAIKNVEFKDPILVHRNYNLLYQYFYFSGKNDFIKTLREDFNFSIKTRKNRLISESCQNLAQGFVWKQNVDSALHYAKLGTEYANRSDSKITLAISFHRQATIFSYFKQFQNAVVKELEFLQLTEEIGNELLKAIAFREIGFISMEVGNYNEADIYFKRALQLADQNFDEVGKGLIYLGLAQNHVHQDNFVQAKNYLVRAQNIFQNSKSDENLGLTAFIFGRIHFAQNNSKHALEDFQLAHQKFELVKNSWKLIEVQHFIGLLYLKEKNYSDAERYLLNSLKSSRLFNSKTPLFPDNYRAIAEVYDATNRIKKAFEYQSIYLNFISNKTINKDAVQIAQLTESNLREERERLIEIQKASIEKERKQKEILEIQRTKNFLITLVIAVILILGIIILFMRVKQVRTRQEQREAEMSQTLLRTQMNPHFVFNAMSVIQSYIFTHNPEKSSKFLVNFSKLMRLILENSPKEFIPLELETEILEKYLKTQKMRFEDRFDFEIQFDENLLFRKALVPPMITQPFVENAIEHGQLHTIEGGKINVTAKEVNSMLQITVQDNGIGRKNAISNHKIKTHKSMAIDITRERIDILNRKYKCAGNLKIEDFDLNTGRGTIVTIQLPLKFE